MGKGLVNPDEGFLFELHTVKPSGCFERDASHVEELHVPSLKMSFHEVHEGSF